MKISSFFLSCITSMLLFSCQKNITEDNKRGTVKITIKNTVKGSPIVLNSNSYTNSFGEQYTISKFKYYMSNVSVTSTSLNESNGRYYLIDENNPASLHFSFEAPVNTYHSISFLLGVDSTHNVSGAQTGALDPLNDMFWTWNSGYVMAKMEGSSPQSIIVNNKVEYHIGGFSGVNSVLKQKTIQFPSSLNKALEIREGKTSEIFIEADFDKWWQGFYDLKISTNPVVTTPGTLAKSISNNYINMFTITDILNY